MNLEEFHALVQQHQNDVIQPGTCDGGSVNCLITGLTATSTAGGNDVDGGLTSIQSPPIVLPAGGTITLRFASSSRT